jgi:glycogen debranching enzyme
LLLVMRKALFSTCPLGGVLFLALVSFSGTALAQKSAAQNEENLELRRPVRSWEFVDATGLKAALLGNETGHLEAWVYPLKLLRNFTLRFHVKDQVLAADELARELIVRPESTTIVYASASWAVRETLLVPPDEPGAMIRLDIDTFTPLQVEAQFVRDFQLMWPAAIGGGFIEWDKNLGVFILGHEEKKYAGIIGSPATAGHQLEFLSNAVSSDVNSLLLKPVEKGHATQYIYVTGSVNGRPEAETRYCHLTDNTQQLQVSARQYFKDFLNRTVSLELPDPKLQAAYDWSRISMYQGAVDNPFLGRGLIAGYRTSGFDQRPGFAWFFGRDSLWTDFAFDSIGDFSTTRAALELIFKFERDDGKVEHEISQTATLVPWVKDFPYAYASADATPLFILAVNDYVTASGDVAFLNQHWDKVWRAYQYFETTYDPLGLSRNGKFGHGWVEGGPLLPVESEVYQSGLGTAALAALANLERISGKAEDQQQLEKEYALRRKTINEVFWSDPQHSLIFALNEKKERVELPTVLSTAPMWFEVFDTAKANATIDHLAAADHLSDWGMRIFSKLNPLFDPEGYHFGSVWPLFTGWASLGEYVYHRPLAAYANLQANAHLVFDGSLGHVTEVLSGTRYEPLPASCPHQIWSSAMVVSPLMRGLLGITSSATTNEIVVAPHTPAGWNFWSAKNVPACGGTVDLIYGKTLAKESLEAVFHKAASLSERDCKLTFSPGVSLHARIGRSIKVQQTAGDQHPTVSASLSSGRASIDIPVQDDFQLAIPDGLPALGDTSSNLRVVQQRWSADHKRVQLLLNGLAGSVYQMNSYGATIVSAEGAQIVNSTPHHQLIEVRFPTDAQPGEYTSWTINLSFSSQQATRSNGTELAK